MVINLVDIVYLRKDLIKDLQREIKDSTSFITIVSNIWENDDIGVLLADLLINQANKDIDINIIKNDFLNNNKFLNLNNYNVILSHILNHPKIKVKNNNYKSTTSYINIDNKVLYIGNICFSNNSKDFNYALKFTNPINIEQFNNVLLNESKNIINNVEMNITKKKNDYGIFKSIYKDIYNSNEILILSSSNINKLNKILLDQNKIIKFIHFNNYFENSKIKYQNKIIYHNINIKSYTDLMIINNSLILNANQPIENKYFYNVFIKINNLDNLFLNEIKQDIINLIY